MKLNLFTIGSALVATLLIPHHAVLAQTTTPIFTMAPTANTSGVVIVDQTTGAISYCTSLVNATTSTAIPSDSCSLLGRATPTSGSSNSLSITASGSSVFVLNNVTGQIVQCATIDNVIGNSGRPEGSCISLGAASK